MDIAGNLCQHPGHNDVSLHDQISGAGQIQAQTSDDGPAGCTCPSIHCRQVSLMARKSRYTGESGRSLAAHYQTVDPDSIHAWFANRLPDPPASVLDVGTGSGRDAAWFARKGFDVVAVDPSQTMIEEARRGHDPSQIRWMNDRLPALERVCRLGMSFDIILLNDVWTDVASTNRARAFRRLISILKPGGLLVFAVRVGSAGGEDGASTVVLDELSALARRHGAFAEQQSSTALKPRTGGSYFVHLAYRLPDDGTGALPLLRHIILNDKKSATHKLGLLRSIARAADSATGMAHHRDQFVALPVGLIALNWIRLYKPLLDAGLPQKPGRQTGMGFVKRGWDGLSAVPAFDLRVGRTFTGSQAEALHHTIRVVVDNIVKMPVRYMTFPGTADPVVQVERARSGKPSESILIDQDYLNRFGTIRIPVYLWNSLSRHAAWIEPALVGEWVALMEEWARNQGRSLNRQMVEQAMKWSDPQRDVAVARQISLQLLESGRLPLRVDRPFPDQ